MTTETPLRPTVAAAHDDSQAAGPRTERESADIPRIMPAWPDALRGPVRTPIVAPRPALPLAIAALLSAVAVLGATQIERSASSEAVVAASAEAAAIADQLPDVALTDSRTLDDGFRQERYTVSPEQIESLRVPAQSLTRADAHLTSRVEHHVEAQMRDGQAISVDSLDIVGLDIPGVAAVYMVQPTVDQFESVDLVVTYDENDNFVLGADVGWGETGQAMADQGAGFDGGTSSTATKKGGSGRTLYFDPAYTSSGNVDHWVTTNYEKWQSKTNAQKWAYNRYATFDAANGGSAELGMTWRGDLIDATIRSRPWNTKTSLVTGGPTNYQPRPQETCSASVTASVNIGNAGSLSIPLMNCYSGQEIYPEANVHSMGTAFYGRTTAQRYLDMAFHFTTSSSSADPWYADYVYMEVQYCKGYALPCGLWNPKQSVRWTDTGW